MSYYALVPAGGSGSRMGASSGSSRSSTPKQYLPLAGRPMISHALLALSQVAAIEKVFVVLAADDDAWERCNMTELGSKVEVLRCGGATRAMTVRNGLDAIAPQLSNDDWILVHDAARPCVTMAQIEALIAACGNDDESLGGLLAIPLADTLKRGSNNDVTPETKCYVEGTVPRANLWQAQTPQMFRLGLLQKALALAPHVTDEASAIEVLGLRPQLVESDAMNLKVTYSCDYQLAEMILSSRSSV